MGLKRMKSPYQAQIFGEDPQLLGAPASWTKLVSCPRARFSLPEISFPIETF
jgi:hypothetical protein